MTDKLRFLMMALLCAICSTSWGETAGFTLTGTPSGADGHSTGTITGTANETWSWSMTGSSYNGTLAKAWQIGSTNKPASSFSISTSGITGTITQIVVNCSSYAAATVNVTVGGTAFGNPQTSSTGQNLGDLTFTGSGTGEIVVTMTNATSGRYMLLKSIIVTYTPASSNQVATPRISLESGSYSTPQTTTISCTTDGATIYYTTNGTTPTTSSTLYTGEITVNKTMTLKAIAVKSGLDNSGVAEASYTLKAATPYIRVDDATSTSKSISIYCSNTQGATIYYTTDGSDPTTSSTRTEYTGAFTLSQSATVKAYAVYGEMDASDVAEQSVTLKVATPTFSPQGGTYSDAQSVTISCATEGATIYYTTDGSTPTTSSSVYSSAINVSETTTIKAIAVYGNMDDSDLASATYTIRETPSDAFIKALSENDLQEGMSVIIVNEESKKTMGAAQENNFYTVEVDIDKSDSPYLATPAEGATILTLEGAPGAWYFKTANGYLYAASSGSNYLKVESEADDNAKATISISNGDATIKFQGSNTRNLLRYNPNTNGNPLFSCYSSGQKPVQIYYRNQGVHTVAAPVITPASGAITEATEITMTCATEGAIIYYTTDGSNPVSDGQLTSSAKVYSSALKFNKAVTINAVAVDQESNFSRIATASYTYTGTVQVPYYENFDAGLGNFTTSPTNSGSSDVAWEFQVNHDTATYGEERKYAYVSGGTYNSKANYVGEDYLISPVIDLTGLESATLNFIHAGHWFGTDSNGADTGNAAVDLAAKKACCHLLIREEGGNWEDISNRISNWFEQKRENNKNMYYRVNSGDIDLSDYKGKKIQVSFYFTSTNTQSGTWNVLKFAVTGTEPEVDNFEIVNMKTDGYVTYVVKNDIDWVKTLSNNNSDSDKPRNIHGYKVVEFTKETAVFVEFGVGNNDGAPNDKTYHEEMIPAETPIILKGTAGENPLVIAKHDDVISKPKGNLLKPSYNDVTATAGQVLLVFQKEAAWTAEDPYNNYAFFKLAAGRTIPDRKAYLNGADVSETLTMSSSPLNSIYLLEDLGKDFTGITEHERNVPAWDPNTPVYDLRGVRMSKGLDRLPKGIYIMGGRKIVIK